MREEGALWRSDNFAARAEGRHFLLAPSEGALSKLSGGWLDDLPDWPELGDLMIAGDLLLYRRKGEGGLLGAMKEIESGILAEGLSWGSAGGEALLDFAAPLAAPPGGGEDLVAEEFPYLRDSAPWNPAGNPIPIKSQREISDEAMRNALRLWEGGSWAAYSQVILPTDRAYR